nr:nucleotide pyrophosphohydrolase [Bacteroidia bacterium]
MENELHKLTELVRAFRDARDWQQFHTPDHLAKSISIEAADLLECFLWKTPEEVDKERVGQELADVFYSMLLLADTFDLNLAEELHNKLRLNAEKYPVDKAKGSNRK